MTDKSDPDSVATADIRGTETPTRVSGQHAPKTAISIGDTIGPYTVEDKLGEGGMGAVFTALHRELGRKVALKVIRDEEAGSDDARARLLREAQAMAKLDHPNIITVYDAGTWQGRVYLAMERASGTTLRAWLKEPRSWRQIRDAFVAAGKGLGAAHAAGIVHRDFKSANVMIGDGRVRVGDFGLARAARQAPEPTGQITPSVRSSASSPSSLDTPLTVAGAVVGTPGYMAPEQLLGEPGNEKSDQFSFCVSLYEALYGQRPYDAKLAPAAGDRVRPLPKDARRVPAFLRRAVLRGLAISPAERWPTMAALVAELERDPGRRARRIAIAGVALAALATGGVLLVRRDRSLPGCDDTLAWDPAAVRAAFGKADTAVAKLNAEPVIAAIDRHAAAWRALQGKTCHAATRDETTYLTLACLRQDRAAVESIVDVLAHADNDIAATSLDTVSRLQPPDRCSDPRALASIPRPPDDPKIRSDVEAIRRDLETARAKFYAGKTREQLARLETLAKAAEATGYKPVLAEVLFELGVAEGYQQVGATATETLRRAEATGEASGDDRLAAHAALELAHFATQEHADAQPWIDRTRILLERIGGDAEIETELEDTLAFAEQARGHDAEAIEHSQKSLAIIEKARDPDDALAIAKRGNLSALLLAQGRFAEAKDAAARAVADTERVLGKDHPNVAIWLSDLGSAKASLGDYDGADADLARALAIAERSFGTGDYTQNVLLAIADLRNEQARFAEAVAAAERVLGVARPDTANYAGALDEKVRALVLQDMAHAAYELARTATALADKTSGADSLSACQARVDAARALAGVGETAEATRLLESALATLAKHAPWWELIATARFSLAQLETDPKRALAAAVEARTALEHVPWRKAEIAIVEAWLTRHAK